MAEADVLKDDVAWLFIRIWKIEFFNEKIICILFIHKIHYGPEYFSLFL